MKRAIVSGGFDDLKFVDFRFLDEASRLGLLHVQVWSDKLVEAITGKAPKFPLAEREYLLQAIRYVSTIGVIEDPQQAHPVSGAARDEDVYVWRDTASARGAGSRIIADSVLNSVSPATATPDNPKSDRKKVIVTGCYDWFHSGHVRFFEECSELGDLYVCVGHDANIRMLKGDGHPLFPAEQRRYIAGSIRYTKLALISTGDGWMDAEPQIERLKPDIYAVNEDGDKPEKRAFCEKHGIEYRVLKRLPKQGLPRRQSTALRGF